MAPVRVHCKHVEVTEVTLWESRAFKLRSSQSPVARAVPTGSGILFMYVAKLISIIIMTRLTQD